MSKVIVTGATGFVGKSLIPFLIDKGHETISLNLRQDFDKGIFGQNDVIIHLAGKAHDLNNVAEPEEYYNVNFKITKELFDVFMLSKADTFIFMSSVKACSDIASIPLTEHETPNPITPYGKSKLMAEEYIQSHQFENKRVYILRPCMIHGPENKGNLSLLYNLVSKGLPWPLGAFENNRSFLSIDNLCFILHELIIKQNIVSGIYNVSDNEPISTNHLVTLIAISLERKIRILNIPKQLIKLLANVGDHFPFPLNTESLKKLTESYIVDNNKIISAIEKKLPLTTSDGLVQTLKTFK